MKLSYIICGLIIVTAVSSLDSSDLQKLSISCQQQSLSCSTCLNHHSSCAWCSDLGYETDRCDVLEKLSRCSSIEKGEDSVVITKQNKSFSDITVNNDNAIQIKPQKITIKLRPGDSQVVEMKYRLAKNYPLDFYFLMDASYSMKDDILTMVKMGKDISLSLRKLTKMYRFGFGAFLDKVLMPFAFMDEVRLKNPCSGTENAVCVPGFGFKHHHSLDNDINAFIRQVNSTSVTANIDNAEGALDALMQVLVCEEKIGWMKKSRKIIFIGTNSLLHLAGDGKLAGVIRKADGQCHLDENGYYTESNHQDYPSVEQIYRKLEKYKVNLIFAVTDSVLEHYNGLHETMPNQTFVTILNSDSSNLLNVIKKGYESAVSTVSFVDDAKKPLAVKYSSRCNSENGRFGNTCLNAKEGEVYNFNLEFKLLTCPEDPNLWNKTIIIGETHLHTEALVVDVQMLCGCKNCEKTYLNLANACNGHGDIECGICKCHKNWDGPNCDCDTKLMVNKRELENKCREMKNDSISTTCYGRGECACGKCQCSLSYTGKYCQCRNCESIKEKVCGGPNRGVCNCGVCECLNGFSGENCDCPLSVDTCIAPGDTSECSGRGICKCGRCVCKTEPFQYRGQYCEKCEGCGGLCKLYRDCVECTILNKCKGYECQSNEKLYHVKFIENLEKDSNDTCLVKVDKNNCQYWYYKYEIDQFPNVKIHILNCKMDIQTGTIAAFVLIPIFVAFILGILAYKWYITNDDKKRLAAFEKQLALTMYANEENPIYKNPITSYEVPRYKED